MEKQQTAVEWLIEQIERKNGKEFASFYSEFIQQAKKMEKAQSISFAKWMYDYKGDINKVEEFFEQFKKEIKSKIQ